MLRAPGEGAYQACKRTFEKLRETFPMTFGIDRPWGRLYVVKGTSPPTERNLMTETVVLTSANSYEERGTAMRDATLANGGGTFDRFGNPVTSGVAVSIKTLLTTEGLPSVYLLADSATYDVGEGNFLGTWWDHENRVFEVSEVAVMRSLEDALELARMTGERYVFDLDKGEEVAA